MVPPPATGGPLTVYAATLGEVASGPAFAGATA